MFHTLQSENIHMSTSPKFITLRTKEDIDRENLNTLEQWQEFVKGDIEVVSLSENKILVVNENGKRMNLPVNKEASEQYEKFIMGKSKIVGNVAMVTGVAIDFL